MSINCTVVLAAGGTGGHIFPAEALAEELHTRGIKVILIMDQRSAHYQGAVSAERHIIRAGTFGRGTISKITTIGNIGVGIFQAWRLLRRLRPQVVVGFGGYPSFPTVTAAGFLGIPAVIHEQNSVLGRANRLLAKRVQAIATSFSNTRFIRDDYAYKTVLTGNPVRVAVRALRDVPYPVLSQDGHIRILVTGGSQGTSVFSQIMPAAIAALPMALRSRIRIDQQCREADIESARAAYAQLQVSADLSVFFTDIPARLAAAHLVIARAGASTITELMAAGRPAIVVPLPSAMDNHQYYNANALEECGGGWMMPQEGFTAAAVSARIETFLGLPERLAQAARCARDTGKIYAARDLASLVLHVAAGRKLVDMPSSSAKEAV